MGEISRWFLWTWIILISDVRSVMLPEITDGTFIDECVKEHNRARSSVNPPASNMMPMSWDEDLAITAREWATKCLFEHNPNRRRPNSNSVGENLWVGYPPSFFNVLGSIKSWDDEKQYYDFDSQACTKVCGHYTQVVWASSNKVGCAAHLCPDGIKETDFGRKESVIFVCNYSPAGNMNRRKPYKSTGWTTADSGSSYVGILVVRPIALILTFVAAYAVRHFYPDVFCYE
ncbi:GLIPR1-like protein 1 [Notolabrus celidotus]|uniref:GLIPR1-like protein 1 n=1 Tax=Notolabrus celidotus TaxID=1203425 RepID=UPI0014900ACF|nr:GLIPR1-like protein 1 [Notolabrus celidotus]